MKKLLFVLSFSIAVSVISLLDQRDIYNRNNSEMLIDQLIELSEQKKKLFTNSTEWWKVEEQLQKVKRRLNGYVKQDAPDEFAEIQNLIRTPFGQKYPEYKPGYKILEHSIAKKSMNSISTNLDWQQRGPGNVAGRARGLIIDPDDENRSTWYVGSVGGGIWKTTNEGNTWRELTEDLPVLSFSTIAMAESNTDIIYAGTGESFFNIDAINGNGIYKSKDRGESWNVLEYTINNIDFNNISRLIVDPEDEQIVLATTTTGLTLFTEQSSTAIMKSTDGGNNWVKVYEKKSDQGQFVNKILQIVSTPGNFDVQLAAVENEGILRSTDAGDTWTKSNSGINDLVGRFELAISPSDSSIIYAASEGSSTTRLHVSYDSGVSWRNISLTGANRDWLGPQGWYDNTIAVHPKDNNIVYVGGVLLHKIIITDSSGTVTDLQTGPVHVDHHNLIPYSTNNGSWRILNSNDGGIGVSGSEDQDWTKPTNGMNTSQFYGVDKKPGVSAYMGGMQDNGTWRSPENTSANDNWLFQIGGDGYEVSWHFNDPSKIIGAFQFNGLMRSTDGRNSYQSATNGLTDIGVGKGPFVTKIAKTNAEPDLLFAVGTSGVWKSIDFGASWKLTNLNTKAHWAFNNLMDVKISRANPNIVWAGAALQPGASIYVSTDQGENFAKVNHYDINMGALTGLATHPHEDSTAYLLFSFANYPKILRTTNLGQTWEDISGFNGVTESSNNGFPDVAVYDLLVMPHTPDTIWAGTEIGLVESTDNGQTWSLADNGLPSVAIWELTQVEDEIIVATHGRGIWTLTVPELIKGETYPPLFRTLSQTIENMLAMEFYLRSEYDSTHIMINEEKIQTLGATPALLDTTLFQQFMTEEIFSVKAVSFRNDTSIESIERTIDAQLLEPTRQYYSSDFNSSNIEDFYGEGFSILELNGFDDHAIHSDHPYQDAKEVTFTLRIPIEVSSEFPNMSYDEIAIIEPGDPGSQYGDQNFWDYVVVEGTKDGISWTKLIDGYDAAKHNEWLQAYNSGSTIDDSFFKKNEIDLTDTFEPGDVILIRFRLFADAFVNGWGWAIDNLVIQDESVNVEDEINPIQFNVSQNYPNPFNPSTRIEFSIPQSSNVELKIYDSLGQLVDILLNDELSPGFHSIEWNASKYASGLYFYQINSSTFSETKKMLLLK